MRVKLLKNYTIYSSAYGDFSVCRDGIYNIEIDHYSSSGSVVNIYDKNTPGRGYLLLTQEFRQALRDGSIRIVE
jgi:hypothetical protein